jgi:hypothetical protein
MIRAITILAVLMSSGIAFADAPSKEVCVESHSKGQDAKEQGKLSLARKYFLTCAQSACPALVQGDCARFADDLTRSQPTVAFVARDSNGVDLPDTTVYVDEMLVTTRLDDGKQYDIDPGKHSVKFMHGSKDQVVTIVINAVEKGRAVNGVFQGPAPAAPLANTTTAPTKSAEPVEKTVRPSGAKVLIFGGAAMTVVGVGLGVWGLTRLPDNCDLGSHQCAAPPGDPVFDDAKSATLMTNVGFIAGGVGLAATIGGLVWYFQGSKTTREAPDRVVTPWITGDGGGLAISGRL